MASPPVIPTCSTCPSSRNGDRSATGTCRRQLGRVQFVLCHDPFRRVQQAFWYEWHAGGTAGLRRRRDREITCFPTRTGTSESLSKASLSGLVGSGSAGFLRSGPFSRHFSWGSREPEGGAGGARPCAKSRPFMAHYLHYLVGGVVLRKDLWDVALDQYGSVTERDARNLGAAPGELAHRSQ